MIDFREIKAVDNSFELTRTITQNQVLQKNNDHLVYLTAALAVLLIGVGTYLVYESYREDSNHKMG